MTSITVRLAGGVGNQLFQYAAGRALSLRTGATLHLDGASFAHDPLGRRFALDRFPMRAERRDLDGWRRTFASVPGLWRFARTTGIAPRIRDTRFLFDRLRGFDARIDDACMHLVLTGYWQDERYFADAAEALVHELDPSAHVSDRVRRLGDELARDGTLGLHVRRGDFVDATNPHGTCSPAYYADATNWMREKVAIGRIAVFSDDPAWARAALDLGAPFDTMDRSPDPSGVDDLWLMSRCRHLVIANSSYSWWAAWMAQSARDGETRLIACPSRWYRASAGPIPHPAPPRWQRIPNRDAVSERSVSAAADRYTPPA